jgi:N,N'-diacetyllegionaminate synthase
MTGMTGTISIGARAIGAGEQPYIIAEIGVNHDGDLDRAMELVQVAHAAGADGIKLQRFESDLLLASDAKLASYQRDAGENDAHKMLARLALNSEQCEQIADYAHTLGLHAIVTVFNEPLVAETATLGFDAWKIASPDIVHRPLIEALAATPLPIICSAGAATMNEVERAIGWLDAQRDRVALLHCVSSYPTPMDSAHLAGITALAQRFDCPIGYSDHTQSLDTGAWAVATGANILEKHLTWNTAAPGPDHATSLTGEHFARYVSAARQAHRALGACAKTPNEIELEVRQVARQSIVAARVIGAGEIITERDITYKRPGGGLEPWRADEIIGHCAAHRIDPDQALTPEDIR